MNRENIYKSIFFVILLINFCGLVYIYFNLQTEYIIYIAYSVLFFDLLCIIFIFYLLLCKTEKEKVHTEFTLEI